MISIIIPVYNAEKTLPRCLDSITNQTIFHLLEVLIVDDGSSDRSSQVIERYTRKYTSFQSVHISNQGVSNARNVGLNLATGDYVAFLDADDYVDRDYYQTLLESMSEDIDIVCSGFIAEYPNMQVPRHADTEHLFNQDQAIEEFLKADLIDPNIWNKLYRRDTIADCQFDMRFRIAEDKLFLFRCIEKAVKLKVIDACKYHYVMNDNSACRKAFSAKKLDSLIVATLISQDIQLHFNSQYSLAKSMEIDVMCRIYGELYDYGVSEEYRNTFNELEYKIRHFSINGKRKHSSPKHFFAFLAARIHPALYNFLKKDLRFQYRNQIS